MPQQLTDLHTAAAQIAALVAEDAACEEQSAGTRQPCMSQPEPVHQTATMSSADMMQSERLTQV